MENRSEIIPHATIISQIKRQKQEGWRRTVGRSQPISLGRGIIKELSICEQNWKGRDGELTDGACQVDACMFPIDPRREVGVSMSFLKAIHVEVD